MKFRPLLLIAAVAIAAWALVSTESEAQNGLAASIENGGDCFGGGGNRKPSPGDSSGSKPVKTATVPDPLQPPVEPAV